MPCSVVMATSEEKGTTRKPYACQFSISGTFQESWRRSGFGYDIVSVMLFGIVMSTFSRSALTNNADSGAMVAASILRHTSPRQSCNMFDYLQPGDSLDKNVWPGGHQSTSVKLFWEAQARLSLATLVDLPSPMARCLV
jgi:hypothetical protein